MEVAMIRTHALWMSLIGIGLLAAPVLGSDFDLIKGPNLLGDNLIVFTLQVGDAADPFDPIYKAGGSVKPLTVGRGEVVRVTVTGTPKAGYHTYPIERILPQQPYHSRMRIEDSGGAVALLPLVESEPTRVDDPLLGPRLEYASKFTWAQDVLISERAAVGPLALPITLNVEVCDENKCPPIKKTLVAELVVTAAAPRPLSEEMSQRLSKVLPASKAMVPSISPMPAPTAPTEGGIFGLIADSREEYKRKMEALPSLFIKPTVLATAAPDLLAFILTGIFWGAVSLITPCVFPMIPITVSYFLKQSEKEHYRPIVMASVYSLTIVVVLTLAAAFLLSAFRLLSINPYTNYFLGGLFVFFALSLFGMYEIELPNSLARFTSAREGKGGLIGTMFMALTFTVISFACVAPFLGGFGGTAAANRPFWHNLLGGLAFSCTFAAPFFLLALFPTMLRALPKSGAWLNSVKVVMGFLELAAAFKFFRAAELAQTAGVPALFTYDMVLGLWIAMCLLCGLYLLGLFRLPHDSPLENIGVPRLMFSVAFLCLAFYLLPALFKVRPGGVVYAWVDSFLLPETNGASGHALTANLPLALTEAKKELERTGRAPRIFLDFTGVICTNCRINEQSVFSKQEIQKLLRPYTIVQVYTDTVPREFYAPAIQAELANNVARSVADAEVVNQAFQRAVFDTAELPLYAVLEPQLDGKVRVVGTYDESRIRNEGAFAEFLKDPEPWSGKRSGQ
jgi:cytochrome c biogenesis protein CcdA